MLGPVDGISRASRAARPFSGAAGLLTARLPCRPASDDRFASGDAGRSSLLRADALGAAQPGGGGAPVLGDLLLGGQLGAPGELLQPGLVALGDDGQAGGAVLAAPAAKTCLTSRSSSEW